MNASDGNNPSENNPSENNQRQKGKGRQKVPMEKIENNSNLQVTFSKRRSGLFKKASELSTLCGAESAVVVFSPGDKAHSFGHPDVETVANRFLNTNTAPAGNPADPLLAARTNATMRHRTQELVSIEAQLQHERQRKRENADLRKAVESREWRPPRIDELDYEQLEQLKRSVVGFRKGFEAKLKNATSLEMNPQVQGSNPGAEIGGSGPSIGYPPMDSNVQGPNYNDQFPFFDFRAPILPDGTPNPFVFDVGGGYYPNAGNPGGSGSGPSAFPSSSAYVDPFHPNVGYGGLPYPNVAGEGGSDVIIPYSYGSPGAVVPYGGGAQSSDEEAADDGDPMETQADDKSNVRGFNGNYGGGSPS